jgi:hypothetical protein
MRKPSEILLVLLLNLGALLGLELGVRAWQGVRLTTTENFVSRQLEQIRQNTGPVVHDPLLGWRLPDNVRTPGGQFTTGAFGLRMNTNAIHEPSQGAILAVGDSFTAGQGVTDSDTWPAHLEQMIREPIYNGAAFGWSVDQMVLRTEQLVPQLHPRVVLVAIFAQDSVRNAYEMFSGGSKPYFAIVDGIAVLRGVPVPKAATVPIDIGAVRRILGHSYLIHWVMIRLNLSAWWLQSADRYKQVHPEKVGIEISCLLMDRLVRLRMEHGLRVVIAMLYRATELSGKEPPWYGPPVLECAKQRGFQTLNTYSHLKLLSERDPQRFVGLWLNEAGQLGHMSAAGNRFIAELFRDILLKR